MTRRYRAGRRAGGSLTPRVGLWWSGLLGAVALFAGCARSGEETPRLAADFKLPRLVGTDSLSMDDLKGQYVLMNFWASWCGPCREEIPALLRIQRRFAGTGLTILGVTVNDRPDDSRGFAHEYGIGYLNVIGNDDLYEDYKLSPWIPTTLLISPDGEILHEWLGPQTEQQFLDGIRSAAPELRELAAAKRAK